MPNYEATRYDINGANLTGIQGVNTGIIIPWSSASIPSGFLECNGQSVSTTTYAALFAVIAYTYGGSGASFNVPDLTDRTVVNKSNTKSLAQTGGANNTSATGNLGGTVANTTLTSAQIPSHAHTITAYAGAGGGINPIQMFRPTSGTSTSGSTGGGGAHNHNIGGTFTGSSVSVLQPYIVLIYIIKT
jgi:microcystin-dependent protein